MRIQIELAGMCLRNPVLMAYLKDQGLRTRALEEQLRFLEKYVASLHVKQGVEKMKLGVK